MYFLLPAIAFLLCLALTPLVRCLATRKGWLAHPAKDRWHQKPTALMGGIAIYAAISIPLFLKADFTTLANIISTTPGHVVGVSFSATLWLGITLLFLLGLLDDFINIKPHTKLVGQILVASLTCFMGFRLHWFTSMTLDTFLSIVWIVGLTNAFNLIDNMDGLCAGIGCIAGLYLSAIFCGVSPDVCQTALIVATPLAAFLVYNFSPASIFMGDSGSLVIGYSLSVLGLYFAQEPTTLPMAAYAVPILALMVPILDTTLVTLIRILSGRKASTGGKDHTSHRLVLMGLSERGAVLFLYLTGITAGFAALFVSRSDGLTSPAVIIPVSLAFLLMGIYLAQLRVYPEKEFSRLRNQPYTPVLMELTYKKQLLLVVLDFALVAFSYYLAYRLRFDKGEFVQFFPSFLQSLPAIIACKLLVFFILGVYRGIWGYMSSNDVFVYLKASFMATVLSVVVVTYIYRFEGFSKGVFVVDWLLTTAALMGTRGSFRIFQDILKRKSLCGMEVFIYGAGRGGEILLREILNNKRLGLKPLGFIDDDPLKTGKKLLGYPVLGKFKDLGSLVPKHHPGGLLISFNHRTRDTLSAISSECRRHDMFVKKFGIHLSDVEEP
jgi:UDP-GlcNAc:undecaprenyl-phosphate GlcNAc-1-phosphate transferase